MASAKRYMQPVAPVAPVLFSMHFACPLCGLRVDVEKKDDEAPPSVAHAAPACEAFGDDPKRFVRDALRKLGV